MGDPNWRAIAVADVNGDNHPDLIWRHTDGWIAVSLLIGRTTVALQLATSTAQTADWSLVATGDLDQDGQADLVWQNDVNGDLVWWRMNGVTRVSSGPLTPGGVANLQWKIRGGGDVDGDGMTDLLWQNTVTGETAVWFMNGTTVRTSTATTPGQLTDLLWRLVAPK
jgi:hypothetical protein